MKNPTFLDNELHNVMTSKFEAQTTDKMKRNFTHGKPTWADKVNLYLVLGISC